MINNIYIHHSQELLTYMVEMDIERYPVDIIFDVYEDRLREILFNSVHGVHLTI